MSPEAVDVDGRPRAVYLVQGEDPSLVAQELSSLLATLEELDSSITGSIEDYGDPGQPDELDLGAVLNACRTPPFLSSWRVVVVRDSSSLDAAAQREIATYLTEPLESTVLVLAHTGRIGQTLSKAVGAAGLVVRAEPQGNRARGQWIASHLHDAGLRLDAAATARLSEHIGEDLARLDGILNTLVSTYGPHAIIHPDQLEPFLGEAGSVAPWDLTDALDAGNIPDALRAVHRLLDAGDRHPLQLLAVLHRHYGAMLRLDGAEISDEAAASVATGLSPFPAKKALAQARRLGHDRITRAITLLADADLDLRGRLGWPDELVMELLIARLAQLVRLPSARASGPARARA